MKTTYRILEVGAYSRRPEGSESWRMLLKTDSTLVTTGVRIAFCVNHINSYGFIGLRSKNHFRSTEAKPGNVIRLGLVSVRVIKVYGTSSVMLEVTHPKNRPVKVVR